LPSDKTHNSLKEDFRKIAPVWGIIIGVSVAGILLLGYFNMNIINYIQYPPKNAGLLSRAFLEEGTKYYRISLSKAQKMRESGKAPNLKGDPDVVRSKEFYLKSIDIFPGQKGVYQRLATLAELEGDKVMMYYYQGQVLIEARQPEEALAKFDSALEIEPDNTTVLSEKVDTLISLKRRDEARSIVGDMLDIDSDNPQALYLVGHIAFIEKEYDAAVENLKKAMDIDPSNITAGFLYARVLESKDMKKEAIQALHNLEQYHPNNARLYHRIGRLLVSQNQNKEAYRYFLKAESLEKNSDSLYLDLARTARKLGKERYVTIYLNRAFEIKPGLKKRVLEFESPQK
jgi:tetratricopeptide (TPR) repeat protein